MLVGKQLSSLFYFTIDYDVNQTSVNTLQSVYYVQGVWSETAIIKSATEVKN